jgi:hypothetical protein
MSTRTFHAKRRSDYQEDLSELYAHPLRNGGLRLRVTEYPKGVGEVVASILLSAEDRKELLDLLLSSTELEFMCDDHSYVGSSPCPYCKEAAP